jgi:Abortive infection alpha
MINIELPEFIDKGLSKPAEAIGKTITNTWDLVFGGFDFYVQKIQHKRQKNFLDFKKQVEQEISQVPEENLVEPPLYILGPTLEASKYYFDSEELRFMFAKLIAATINSDTIKQTHPSFVEIIKQLSPLDAQNLAFFKNKSSLPIAEYQLHFDGGHTTLQTNVFLENEKTTNLVLNSSSITNLYRLGLISIVYGTHFKNVSFYDKFKTTDVFSNYKNGIENKASGFEKYDYIHIEMGICEISPLGRNFINSCL